MADDEMLCESLGEQIHRARKEGAKSERERIFKDLEDVFILYKVGKEKRWMIPIELYGVIKKRHSAEIEKEVKE